MLTQSFAERNNLPIKEGALLRGDDQTLAVISNSPAQKAGLREGDIITKIGDKDVNTKSPLSSVVVQFKVGQNVEIKYYRDGKEQTTKVTLEASPATQQ